MSDKDVCDLCRRLSEVDIERKNADVEDDREDSNLSKCGRSLTILIWSDDRVHPERHEYCDC